MKPLSPNFSWAEVTESQTASREGIDNSVPQELENIICQTAQSMEAVRTVLQCLPISISSWYRCLLLNRAIGSKDSSQHLKGEAVDFTCAQFGTPFEICKKLVLFQDVVKYDQLILEHTWVHISFNSNPASKQKLQVLSLLKSGGYASGLTDVYGKALT